MEETAVEEPGLILAQKWEDVAVYMFSCILRDLPKSERYTLGADIRSLLWQVEDVLVQLALRSGSRWNHLNFVDVKAKTLMSMIRVGIKAGVIPQRRHEPVSQKLDEIGRIVGGLKKVR